MKKNSISLYSRVVDGRLEKKISQTLNDNLNLLNGKIAKITIEESKVRRSLRQNAYYWGVVIPCIINEINSYGNDFNAEEMHIFIKNNIIKDMRETVVMPDGTIYEKIRSTRKLTKVEFSDYIEKLKKWALDTLKIDIPDPVGIYK